LMPDPEFYASCIEDSFTELRDAARAMLAEALAEAPIASEPKPAKPIKPAGKNKPAAKTKPAGRKKSTDKPRKAAKK
jgi:diacylglycerol O-acyltransferase